MFEFIRIKTKSKRILAIQKFPGIKARIHIVNDTRLAGNHTRELKSRRTIPGVIVFNLRTQFIGEIVSNLRAAHPVAGAVSCT